VTSDRGALGSDLTHLPEAVRMSKHVKGNGRLDLRSLARVRHRPQWVCPHATVTASEDWIAGREIGTALMAQPCCSLYLTGSVRMAKGPTRDMAERDAGSFARPGNGGLIVTRTSEPIAQREAIMKAASRYRPAVYPLRFFVQPVV
jgi:hypothetical protein